MDQKGKQEIRTGEHNIQRKVIKYIQNHTFTVQRESL